MGWHSDTDARWFHVMSANEWVLAFDEDTPVMSERRALQLLVEHHGPVRVAELAQLEAALMLSVDTAG
jgi:hypothetical protein